MNYHVYTPGQKVYKDGEVCLEAGLACEDQSCAVVTAIDISYSHSPIVGREGLRALEQDILASSLSESFEYANASIEIQVLKLPSPG